VSYCPGGGAICCLRLEEVNGINQLTAFINNNIVVEGLGGELMGLTIAQKILARASGSRSVAVNEIVVAKIDLAMMHDSSGPRRIVKGLKQLGVGVWDANRVAVIADHFVPAGNEIEAEIQVQTRRWVEEQEIKKFHELEGVCHIVALEKGYVLPGMMMVGGDSHTCTAGVTGALAIPLGSTDMLGVIARGYTWLKVPETIKIVWEGKLASGVTAKDMILYNLKQLGSDGATYKVVEFAGVTVRQLNMDERMTFTNMAIEMGAKTGIIEPDDTVFDYLKGRTGETYQPFYSDPDAEYQQIIHCQADRLEPLVACPHSPDNVTAVAEISGLEIQQALVGACTGAKYYDLYLAAQVLRGRKVAPGVRLLVAPASKEILGKAIEDGIISQLTGAGATLLPPACGPCAGLGNGVLAAGERCVASTNRNFQGRMGSREAEVYLGSAATVAASAVEGKITDPRAYLK